MLGTPLLKKVQLFYNKKKIRSISSKLLSHNEDAHRLYVGDNDKYDYFTGIIEAVGYIYIPSTEYSKSGIALSPSIQITIHSKDLPFMIKLFENFDGTLSKVKGKKAYRIDLCSRSDIFKVIYILNGRLKTDLYNSFSSLINWTNLYWGGKNQLECGYLCQKPIGKTGWLSGFLEHHGSFQLRYTPKTSTRIERFGCSLELTQSHSQLIMREIGEFLNSVPKIQNRKDRRNSLLRLRTSTVESNLILINYLTNFPLYSSKLFEFEDWKEGARLFEQKNHRTIRGRERLLELKNRMNKRRVDFRWSHLKGFYF